jgi:hypothetical protein
LEKASAAVPKTDDDRLADRLWNSLIYPFVATFIFTPVACVAVPGPLHLLPMLGGPAVFIGMGIWAMKLEAPRKAAIADMQDAIVREEVKELEAEQLEYESFYRTPEWRELCAQVYRRDGKVCKNCGRRRDLTVDHILPRSRYPERALDPTNLQVLCRKCNSAKGAKNPSTSIWLEGGS